MTYPSGKTAALDIDALLQDSYLLVVTLRQQGTLQDNLDLWAHCTEQVERTRRGLAEAGVSDRVIDQICYAQCALLDETVLGRAQDDIHAAWAAKPLQAHFFNRHVAGIQLYEDLREALGDPACDRLLLTCYHRVLLLGFQGCYQGERSAAREQLLAALEERVAPFAPAADVPVLLREEQSGALRLMYSPWLHLLAAGSLVAGLWWGLEHLLTSTIGMLLLAGV